MLDLDTHPGVLDSQKVKDMLHVLDTIEGIFRPKVEAECAPGKDKPKLVYE